MELTNFPTCLISNVLLFKIRSSASFNFWNRLLINCGTGNKMSGQHRRLCSWVKLGLRFRSKACFSGRVVIVKLVHRNGVGQSVVRLDFPKLVNLHVRFVNCVIRKEFRNSINELYSIWGWISNKI